MTFSEMVDIQIDDLQAFNSLAIPNQSIVHVEVEISSQVMRKCSENTSGSGRILVPDQNHLGYIQSTSMISKRVKDWIYANHSELMLNKVLFNRSMDPLRRSSFPEGLNMVTNIYVGELESDKTSSQIVNLSGNRVDLTIHVFACISKGPTDFLSNLSNLDAEEEDGISQPGDQYINYDLPNQAFQGLWTNLILSNGIQLQLLNYVKTSLLFSLKGVDANVISVNRIVLLYGPPGTGKTTLCKALAQKAAVRFIPKYFSRSKLIEINSHSLFSKWFSESGKLVMKLFQKIFEWVNDSSSLVFIIIDEVESLTAARTCALSGSEPSDSIRVVNALLTQIDKLKSYPNVLILCTSNITETVDPAFIDRADLKLYLGLPDSNAIYIMLSGSLQELGRLKLINFMDPKTVASLKNIGGIPLDDPQVKLLDLSIQHQGRISGRSLRKLPLTTYSNNFSSSLSCGEIPSVMEYLNALERELESASDQK